MQLVLDTTGLRLSVRNQCFHITDGEQKRSISPARISSIHITAAISLTSPALMLAVEHAIPVVISEGSRHATLRSAAYANLPQYRRWQALHSSTPDATHYMAALLLLKAEGQLANLHAWRSGARDAAAYAGLMERCGRAVGRLRALACCDDKDLLRAAEATMARHYWDGLALVLPPEFAFSARQHRPAADPFNAALNYWYGMLYHTVEAAIHATGLDAACALFHAEDYSTPALCYDLIEPFRPGADAALVALCLNGRLAERHFEPHEGGLWLSRAGKGLLLPAYHEWLHVKIIMSGRSTLRKNHILQAPAGLLRHIRDRYEAA